MAAELPSHGSTPCEQAASAQPALASPTTSTDDLQTLLPGESRTVTVELGRVSAELLNTPLTLKLLSPMLQEGQSIAFATESPWTADTGELTLAWEISCETDTAELVTPGVVVGTNVDGCGCVCDVDGQFRACGAVDCQ